MATAPLTAGDRAGPSPARAPLAARWLMPTLGNLCLIAVLFLLVLNARRFLDSADTGWHIRAGDWIWRHHAVPRRDEFSYTVFGHEWLDWEWMSDALMSAVHRARGLSGLVGAAIVLLAAGFAALERDLARRGVDAVSRFAFTLLAAFGTMVHWEARPHLVSIVLLIVASAGLDAYRRSGSRWIWALPPLVALWANLHGAFVVLGPMLAIYALGTWLEGARADPARAARRAATYGIVGVLSAAAALVTPYGLRIVDHLRGFAGNPRVMDVAEFHSPDFHLPEGRLLELLLLLAAVAAFRAARRGRWVETGLVLFWAHMALQSVRHMPLAAVVLVPIVAEQWTAAWSDAGARLSRGAGWLAARVRGLEDWYAGMLRIDRQLNGGALYLLTFGVALLAIADGRAETVLRARFDPRRFPVAAVDFLATRPTGVLTAHGFASDWYGSYLIYRLAPEVRVFVDGRFDPYADGPVLDDMDAIASADSSWASLLDRYQVEWMLVPRHRLLEEVAVRGGRWRNLYQDATASVLVRAGSGSAAAGAHAEAVR
jgi:hypothetical protein